MLFLFIFGNNIEDRFGRLWYLLFYPGLRGGSRRTASHWPIANSTEVLIGASGAIAGVLGAYLLLFPRNSGVDARVVHPVTAARVGRARRVVPAAVGVHVGLRGHLGRFGAYLAHVYGFVAAPWFALIVRARRWPARPPPRPPPPSALLVS